MNYVTILKNKSSLFGFFNTSFKMYTYRKTRLILKEKQNEKHV